MAGERCQEPSARGQRHCPRRLPGRTGSATC